MLFVGSAHMIAASLLAASFAFFAVFIGLPAYWHRSLNRPEGVWEGQDRPSLLVNPSFHAKGDTQ